MCWFSFLDLSLWKQQQVISFRNCVQYYLAHLTHDAQVLLNDYRVAEILKLQDIFGTSYVS